MCDFIFRLVEEMSNSDGNTNSTPCSRVAVNTEGRHSRPAVSKTTLKVCINKTLACQGCIGCKTDLMARYCGLYQKEHCDRNKIARRSECHVECCVLVPVKTHGVSPIIGPPPPPSLSLSLSLSPDPSYLWVFGFHHHCRLSGAYSIEKNTVIEAAGFTSAAASPQSKPTSLFPRPSTTVLKTKIAQGNRARSHTMMMKRRGPFRNPCLATATSHVPVL